MTYRVGPLRFAVRFPLSYRNAGAYPSRSYRTESNGSYIKDLKDLRALDSAEHYRHSGLTDLKRCFPDAQILLETRGSSSWKSFIFVNPDSEKKRIAAWRGTGPRATGTLR